MINDKKIKDQPGLVKREASVVNTNKEEYLAALQRRQKEQQLDSIIERAKTLESKVEDIDEKLNLILELLKGK